VVFGSTAKGQAREDSDLDVALVVPDPDDPTEFDRTELALSIPRRLRYINAKVTLDILVYTGSEFEQLASQPTLPRSELIEGGETACERVS